MSFGAGTPQELETLLEDAFLQQDATAVADLFDEGGLLVSAVDGRTVPGRAQIVRTASTLCDGHFGYVAETCRVWQAQDIALVVNAKAFNVMRRGWDGNWRYVIARLR